MRKQSVLLFATLKDRVGASRVEVDLDEGATVKELKAKLANQFPAVAGYLPNVLVAD